jgi:hypothetical protein
LILNSFLEGSIETKETQAPEVINGVAQAEATNAAATVATDSMNKPNNTEEETKTAQDNHNVENTEIATVERVVSEDLFFDITALDPQHVNKKAKQDFGFWVIVVGQPAWRNAELVDAQYVHFFK